jgi:hypothetical protein
MGRNMFCFIDFKRKFSRNLGLNLKWNKIKIIREISKLKIEKILKIEFLIKEFIKECS